MGYCRAEKKREKAAKRESSMLLEKASAGRQRLASCVRSGVQTAVNIQPCAGDLSGCRARQEGHGGGNVLRLTVMTNGNHLALGFSLFTVLGDIS